MENMTLTKEITFTTEENAYGELLRFTWNTSCTVNVYRGEYNHAGIPDFSLHPMDTFTLWGDDGGAATEAQVTGAIREWLKDYNDEGEAE